MCGDHSANWLPTFPKPHRMQCRAGGSCALFSFSCGLPAPSFTATAATCERFTGAIRSNLLLSNRSANRMARLNSGAALRMHLSNHTVCGAPETAEKAETRASAMAWAIAVAIAWEFDEAEPGPAAAVQRARQNRFRTQARTAHSEGERKKSHRVNAPGPAQSRCLVSQFKHSAGYLDGSSAPPQTRHNSTLVRADDSRHL